MSEVSAVRFPPVLVTEERRLSDGTNKGFNETDGRPQTASGAIVTAVLQEDSTRDSSSVNARKRSSKEHKSTSTMTLFTPCPER